MSIYDRTTSLDNFLAAAAAKQPTPGGGSIAALCGALASSMGEMVLNYSIGKKSLVAHEGEFQSAVRAFHRARMLMLELMVDDQTAYLALTAARKLPAGSNREREIALTQTAAIGVPEAIGATAVGILRACQTVIDSANFYLLSDLAVCADLAMATVRCAVYNVRVNLGDLADPVTRQKIAATMDEVLSHALALIQDISPRIWNRHSRGPGA